MKLKEIVQQALLEDIPTSDITTDSLECDQLIGEASLIAKQTLVLSGTEPFTETCLQTDTNIKIIWNFKDGDAVMKNDVICKVSGSLPAMLKAERTALNFLGHLAGIATKTAQFVKKTQGTHCKITDTRKTTPGLRILEKKAVRDGGGFNHRLNLSDAILIKENHIRASGGIQNAVSRVRGHLPGLPIEIEVTNENEAEQALALKVERMLLDNMSNETMARIIKKVDRMCVLEASGNMTLDRIESVAKLGVDFISVGALTHSAPSADVSLLFKTENR